MNMLTEEDVIELLVLHLKSNGFIVEQKLNTKQQGIDIIARQGTKRYLIEAKGETSSKPGTRRYGKPFTRNQVKTHVSVALMTSMKLLDNENEKDVICMAFPDNADHREQVKTIKKSIKKLGIKIYWVSTNFVNQK